MNTRKFKYLCLIAVVTLLSYSTVLCQIKVFEYDLEKSTFTPADTPFPFDEKFQIRINNKKLNHLKLKYKLRDYSNDNFITHKHYRLIKDPPVPYVTADIQSDEEGNFLLTMDALHPNEHYLLELEGIKHISIDDNKQNKLVEDINDILNESFSYKKDNVDLDELYKSLSTKLSKSLGEKSIIQNGKEIFLEPDKFVPTDELKKFAVETKNAHDKIRFQYNEICGDKKNKKLFSKIITAFQNNQAQLKTILTKISFNDEFKVFNNQITNAEYSTSVKNMDVANLILEDLQYYDFSKVLNCDDITNSNLLKLFNGTGKISGNIISHNNKFDINSGKLIFSFLKKLSILTATNKSLKFSKLKNFQSLLENINKWIFKVDSFNQRLSKVESNEKSFNDLFSKTYSNYSKSIPLSSIPPIDASENAYIGIDFGYLFAPNISSSFTFQGLNFHLRPVNRSAKYDEIQGWDEVLKRFSFNIGIAQRINNPNDNFKPYFEVGSPILGLGFRMTRMLRFSAGAIWHKQKSDIPIILEPNTKATYFISFSFDFKLNSIFNKIKFTK